MGSFTYDSSVKHKNGFMRVIPVGLQWGNDVDRTVEEMNEPLKEAWVNETAKKRIITHARPMLGFQNRLAGPADSFLSSCSSCHACSQIPSVKSLVPQAPVDPLKMDIGERVKNYFFRNLPCGNIFDPNLDYYNPTSQMQKVYSLDYSLQLQNALNNFFLWRKGAGYADMAEQEVHDHQKKIPGLKMLPNRTLHEEAVRDHHEEHTKTVRGEIAMDHTHRGDK
jgi:hypothetical protein